MGVILGVHGMFFSSRPSLTRAFLRDKLKLPSTDIGGGWLVFDVPVAQVSIHPKEQGPQHAPGMHDVSFLCDDLEGSVAELRSRGVKFDDAIEEHSYGFTIHFRMPGGIRAQLWEPKYETRVSLRKARGPRSRHAPPARRGDGPGRARA